MANALKGNSSFVARRDCKAELRTHRDSQTLRPVTTNQSRPKGRGFNPIILMRIVKDNNMVEEAIANLIISIKTSAVELEHKAKLFKKYTKKTG